MTGSLSFPNSCITSKGQQRGEEAPCSDLRLCQAAPWDCGYKAEQGPAHARLPTGKQPRGAGEGNGASAAGENHFLYGQDLRIV